MQGRKLEAEYTREIPPTPGDIERKDDSADDASARIPKVEFNGPIAFGA